MGKSASAPTRDNIPELHTLGVTLHPDTMAYVANPQSLADAIGGNREQVPCSLAL
jgi:hypothetical protein